MLLRSTRVVLCSSTLQMPCAAGTTCWTSTHAHPFYQRWTRRCSPHHHSCNYSLSLYLFAELHEKYFWAACPGREHWGLSCSIWHKFWLLFRTAPVQLSNSTVCGSSLISSFQQRGSFPILANLRGVNGISNGANFSISSYNQIHIKHSFLKLV